MRYRVLVGSDFTWPQFKRLVLESNAKLWSNSFSWTTDIVFWFQFRCHSFLNFPPIENNSAIAWGNGDGDYSSKYAPLVNGGLMLSTSDVHCGNFWLLGYEWYTICTARGLYHFVIYILRLRGISRVSHYLGQNKAVVFGLCVSARSSIHLICMI